MDFSRLLSRFAVAAMGLMFFTPESLLYAQGADEYIVQFQDGTTAAVRRAAAAEAGAAVRRIYGSVSAAAVHAPNDRALEALRRNPTVVAIVPNRPVFAYQSTNAPGGKKGGGSPQPPQSQVLPAGVARVGAARSDSNGAGVGVAILDTGIDLAHADLSVAPAGFSATGPSCQDGHGHGTHVAGTVAALDNTRDVVGVAPAAQLYCVKVLDNNGSGSDADVIAGLDWVLANHDQVSPPIKVINMSLGRPGSADDNPIMQQAIIALDEAGVSIVVAAGNDPFTEVSEHIPAAYSQVIAVASTTALSGSNQCQGVAGVIASDTASYFTTDGPDVTVSAPGDEREDISRSCFINAIGILSTKAGGGTTRMSGTSMAAPHVAGIAARHYQSSLGLSPSYVKGVIADTADRRNVAPLNSPSTAYTHDGVREGIAKAP